MPNQCSSCKAKLPREAKFCPECGATVHRAGPVTCPRCKTQNPSAAKFCKSCGAKLALAQTRQSSAAGSLFRYLPILGSVAVIAFFITVTYYYTGFIQPLQGKTGVHPGQQTQTQSQPPEEHNHPAPSPEQIAAAKAELSADPENPELNIRMGNLLFDSGRFSEAIPYYQKALEKQPNNADVVVDLGVCYFNLKDYTAAAEQFDRALQIDPNHLNALYNSGVVAIQLKDRQKLIQNWSRLMSVAPNSPMAQRAAQILEEIHSNVENQSQEQDL